MKVLRALGFVVLAAVFLAVNFAALMVGWPIPVVVFAAIGQYATVYTAAQWAFIKEYRDELRERRNLDGR